MVMNILPRWLNNGLAKMQDAFPASFVVPLILLPWTQSQKKDWFPPVNKSSISQSWYPEKQMSECMWKLLWNVCYPFQIHATLSCYIITIMIIILLLREEREAISVIVEKRNLNYTPSWPFGAAVCCWNSI